MAKKIYVEYCSVDVYVDNYERGQSTNSVNYWDLGDVKGVYESIDDLIERLSYYWGFPKDKESYGFSSEEGVLYSGVLTDEEGNTVEKGYSLYNDWVSGNIDLYYASLYCKVSIIEERPMTDADAKEFGIPLY